LEPMLLAKAVHAAEMKAATAATKTRDEAFPAMWKSFFP
jgi:hypothetical protein